MYALVKYGSILTIGFFFIGFSQFIISWFFFNSRYAIPAGFLLLSGLGVCIIGLIPRVDKHGNKSKTHVVGAGMQFLFFPLGVITYSILSSDWYFSLPFGILTTVGMFAVFIGHQLYRKQAIRYFGVIQKTNILLINTWLLLIPLTL